MSKHVRGMNHPKYCAIPAAVLATGALLASVSAQTKVYIDPGHGGSDPGAVNQTHGTKEADRVLFTAKELRKFLDEDTNDARGGSAWTVRMSRTTDTFIRLRARSTDANHWGADRFLSIHQNAFNASASGTETFSLSNTGTAARLRNLVQEEAIKAWGLKNRSNKTANFSVLSNTSMPAVLTEMGFIDSSTDHPFCASDEKCRDYAKHLLFALQRHYGKDPYFPAPPGIVVDNRDGGAYTETGEWQTSASAGFWNADSRYGAIYRQTPPNTATFRPTLAESGRYEVYAWWVPGANRSPGAGFVVNHLYGSTLVRKDQRSGGNRWNLLGTFNFGAGNEGNEGNVRLDSARSTTEGAANPVSTVVMADAVRFVRVGDVLIEDVVVDNTDGNFRVPSRQWFPSAYSSGYLGPNYHARPTGYVSDPATWSATLPAAGRWEVFARWTTGSNRTSEAPYIVYHAGGRTVKNVDQRRNNATWISLGTYEFAAGHSHRVQLSCWTDPGAFVIADAVKFVKK